MFDFEGGGGINPNDSSALAFNNYGLLEKTDSSQSNVGVALNNQSTGTVAVGTSGTSGPGALSTNNLTLTSASNLDIEVNASTSGGYGQVRVNGTVSLNGSILNLTGTPVVQLSDVLTLISNDGTDAIIGTFANLPEGSNVTFESTTYILSYKGGDGNDVTLTALADASSTPTINVAGLTGDQKTTIGRYIELNSSHDLGNVDANGNPLDDDEPYAYDSSGNPIYHINVGGGPIDPDLVDASLHFSGPETITYTLTFTASKLRVWDITSPSDPVNLASGKNFTVTVPSGGLDVPLKVEGISLSGSKNDSTVIVSTTNNGTTLQDTAAFTVVGVAEYIDADNNNGYGTPDESKIEGADKQNPALPGKVIVAAGGDADGDGIADFADGYNLDGIAGNADDSAGIGDRFTPVVIQLAAPIDISGATITFGYSGSAPMQFDVADQKPAPGYLRLWTKDGAATRDGEGLENGGDFITPGIAYSAASLGLTSGGTVTLWAEGIRPVNATDDADRTITLSVNLGSDGAEPFDELNPARVGVTVTAPTPADPTSLSAITDNTTIHLSWVDDANDMTGYVLDRSTDSAFTSDVTSVADIDWTQSSYDDTSLADGHYFYRLYADNADTLSNAYAGADAAVGNTPPITVLSGLDDPVLVHSVTTSSMNFLWQGQGSGGDTYTAEYSTDPDFGAYQTQPLSAYNGTLSGLSPGTTYYLRIRTDGPDASYTSLISFITASQDAPPAPQFIYMRPLSATEAEVSWPSIYQEHPDDYVAGPPVPSSDTPLQYAIEYSANGAQYTRAATINLASDVFVSRYIVQGLQMGGNYLFRLRVIDPTTGAQSGTVTTWPERTSEMTGAVSGWVQTQPVDTTGWYNLSFKSANLSQLSDGNIVAAGMQQKGYPGDAFTPSLHAQTVHGSYSYSWGVSSGDEYIEGTTSVIYDLFLQNTRIWAASSMDALTRGITGTIESDTFETIYYPNNTTYSEWLNSDPVSLQDSNLFHPHAPHYVSTGRPSAVTMPMAMSGGSSMPADMEMDATTNNENGDDGGSGGGSVQTNDGRSDGIYFFPGECAGESQSVPVDVVFDPINGRNNCGCGNPNTPDVGDPVQAQNGAFAYSHVDLIDNSTAYPFGQARSFDDDNNFPTSTNGNGMFDDDLPQIIQDPGGEGFGVAMSGTETSWFYGNSFSAGVSTDGYQAAYNKSDRLTVNYGTISYTKADGTAFQFYGFDANPNSLGVNPALQGKFLSRTDPDGTITQATYTDGGELAEVDRFSGPQDVSSSLDSFVYNYYQNGPSAGQLQNVTWRMRPDAESSWSTVQSVMYDYYDSKTTIGGAFVGNVGDLMTASVSGASGSTMDTTYYRYSQISTPLGERDHVSYVFEPDAYARLGASVAGPLTASNETVAPYATVTLAYDDQGRVQTQVDAGSGASTASGLGTYTFTYSINPDYVTTRSQPAIQTQTPFYWIQNYPRSLSEIQHDSNGNILQQQTFNPTGTDLPDYNTWWYETIVNRPDNSTETIYMNASGEPMLNVVSSADGTQRATYDKYDNDGRLIQQAQPSAVTGYDPSVPLNDSLTINANGQPLISSHSGLVETIEYGIATGFNDPNAIGAAIQPLSYFGQQGEADPNPVLLETDTYQMNNDVAWQTSATTYRNNSGADDAVRGPLTTTYAYQYNSTGLLPSQMQISDPPIPSSENGNGDASPYQQTTDYDSFGRLSSNTDKDGYQQGQTYDPMSGAVATQTLDSGGQNLTTSTTSDPMGRPTSVTDANGNVSYYTYNNPEHEYRIYPGWHEIGTTGNYTTTGPIEMYRQDWAGAYVEKLTYAPAAAFNSVVPQGNDPITNLQSLVRDYENKSGQVISEDSYFDLDGINYSTAAHLGTVNVNYYHTTYGYDNFGRQNEVTSPNGTLTKNVYDALDRVTKTLVGTSEANLTDVADYQYDNGGSGDSNLTQLTLHRGGGQPDNVTQYVYDYRDRQIGEVQGVGASNEIIAYTAYDNLNEPILVEQFAEGSGTPGASAFADSNGDGIPDGLGASELRAKTILEYDDRGELYRAEVYSVDSNTGGISAGETTNYFYDGRNNVIAEQAPTGLWTKDIYDGADRLAGQSQTDGTGGTLWANASSTSGDQVLSQTQYLYDGDGNVIETVQKDRLPYDDYLATGDLGDPSGNGGPAARISYTGSYYDAADRDIADVNVGTNVGIAWTRPDAVPASIATELVTLTAYNPAGWVGSVTDPLGLVTAYSYDALGRTTQTVADYTDGTPTDSSNQTTTFTYDGDDNLTSETAVMPAGETSQTTDYIYGVGPANGSAISDNDLLYQTQYPDPSTGAASGSSDTVETYSYDAIGEQTTYTDRDGTTHAYTYDSLGRKTADTVTTFGAGVDQSVAKLSYTYDDAGRLHTASSLDSSSNIVNQDLYTYDGLGNVAREYQSVSGEVDTSSTPYVGYSYDQTTDRLTSMVYPNGRTLNYNYDNGYIDGIISRLRSIGDASGVLQSYLTYLGLDTPLGTTDGNGVTSATTLGEMNRIQNLSYNNASGEIDSISYGYNQDGDVLSKRNNVLSDQSELYTYDGLNRLATMSRGTLNADGTAITNATASQSWDLNALGDTNSSTANGTTTTRTNNAQNQATVVAGNTLTYDANGNTLVDQNGQHYTYDAWNRLVKVANSGGTVIAAYTYDPASRRVTQTEGGVTTDLYYSTASTGQVVEERQGGTTTAQYVWSPFYVNQLTERDDQPNGSGQLTRRLYVEQDANYNTTSLTDASGNVVQRFVYSAYGVATVETASGAVTTDAYNWIITFQGGRRDPATGLIQFGVRVLNPWTGTWLQEDPAGYINGSDRYQLELDAPEEMVDPTGLSAVGYVGWKFVQYGGDLGIDLAGAGPEDLAGDLAALVWNAWARKKANQAWASPSASPQPANPPYTSDPNAYLQAADGVTPDELAHMQANNEGTGAKADSSGGAETPSGERPTCPKDQAEPKVPKDWGPGKPNRKKPGWRWQDPSNKGNSIRVDEGDPNSPLPYQRPSHVVINSGGRPLLPDGSPLPPGESIQDNPSAHIPLDEWLKWKSWNSVK